MIAIGLAAQKIAASDSDKLAFKIDDKGNLAFDTGVVKGSMQKDGAAEALTPISYVNPAVAINNTNHGLLTPYRFLTPQKRYGFGSWEWPRTGKVLPDGSAELQWQPAADRPFAFSTHYHWKSADTLDFTLSFTPQVNLEKFELFLGSYFRNFKRVKAFVEKAGNGAPGLDTVSDRRGGFQFFPRGEDIMPMVNDGRWNYPPYPIKWDVREPLAAPLGMMAEPNSGVTVLLMSPPDDCFALSATKPSWGQGAYYLSLFGKDVAGGQTVVAHVRLVFGRNVSDADAIRKYADYLKELGIHPDTALAAALVPPPVRKDWIVAEVPSPSVAGWIRLFDGKHLYGGVVSDADLDSGKVRLKDNGELRLDSAGVDFKLKGRNVVLRAHIKKYSGQSCSIAVRFDRENGTILQTDTAWFNGGNHFGIGRTVDAKWQGLVDTHAQDRYDQFFDLELRAEGPNLTLKANGRTICEATDMSSSEGRLSVGSARGVALVTSIEAKILDRD
jgi:hypothetical protein